jgi:abortive infection bacteriophage resistance protein
VNYTKRALSLSDQADQLLKRGLVARDKQAVIEKLEAVSYYRLSGYWVSFRRPDDTFEPGTTLDMVWRRYTFDRQLRLLVLDAIERVEIAVRTRIVDLHAIAHGPFAYANPASLPGLGATEHAEFLRRINQEANRSSEQFVHHFKTKYTSQANLPLWMACELMTFGNLYTLFRGLDRPKKQTIAGIYGVADSVFESWLGALNQVRNICAHHARLWNRVFGMRPQIPRQNKHPFWHTPVSITNDRLFGVMTVLHYLLRQVAPRSRWFYRWEDLLAHYPEIPRDAMGFPVNWRESTLWQISPTARH